MSSAMRQLKRRVIAATLTLLTAIAVIVIPQTPASAYALLNCRWPSTTITWSDQTGGGAYGTPVHQAVADWNNSSAPTTFNLVGSNAQFRIVPEYWGTADWAGRVDGATGSPSCSNGRWSNTPFTVWLNRRFLDGFPATSKRGVTAHELGHVLGLAHSGGPACFGMVIMFTGATERYNCGITTPQYDDIAGVEHIY